MAKYFGTNGARGKLDLLTPEFVSRMCTAFGIWSGGKGNNILLARDTRTSGEMLEGAALAGLLSAGCSVTMLGICPSPTVEFSVLKHKASGAVTITASHNPPDWNALKFVDSRSIAVSRERGEEIEKIFEAGPPQAQRAQWNEIQPLHHYATACADHAAAVKAAIDTSLIKRRKPKLVLDCANGTMGQVCPQFFKSLGCEVITLNAQMDGHFPGRPSEPTEANIGELLASVKELGADTGIAWDGDGDRVVFVDETGKFVIGDKIFALSEKIALAQKKGPVVTTVSTTNAIRDIAEKAGCKMHYCRIGAPYISEEMARVGAVVGGEEVGGVVWPSISYGKDGLMTAAKIVEAICRQPLSNLVAGLPSYFNSKTKLPCAPERKYGAVASLAGKLQDKGKPTTIDGVRIDFPDDSWVIVRASGTENYIRIFAEAKSQEKANELMQSYVRMVDAAIG
ncbi:MAG: phosphoglucosamine mutase [Candidatus Burarchaeum sp.]|nr:phosphoglucosamine mutase [Candidatus Burarchaeum sp.]MDO8339035.1 phosphoglucosamine mutase [Candidatus Burarchaeum sp.]